MACHASCSRLPDARIAVGSGRVLDAWECARLLRQQVSPWTQLLVDEWAPCDAERLVVSLYKKLICSSVEIAERDIVFMLRADEMLSVVGDRLYPHLGRAHVFGFLPWTTTLAPQDERLLGEWYGLDRMIVPNHGFRCRDVKFAFLNLREGSIKGESADYLRIRREGIWANGSRNAQITELAIAIRTRQRAYAEAKLPAISPLLPSDRDPGVLITVQSKEHANRLLEFLPGWGSDGTFQAAGDSNRPFVFGASVIAPNSITHELLEGVDVIIRADGSAGSLPLSFCELVDPVDQPRKLLVVDFFDRGHPVLRRWSRQRRAAYYEVGWFQAGVDRMAQLADRWLALED